MAAPPCFLRSADVARLLVRHKTRVRSLAPYQLKEVLAFQRGEPYDGTWLRAATSAAPHFQGNTERRWDLVVFEE
mgnify:CR=1 FL=1